MKNELTKKLALVSKCRRELPSDTLLPGGKYYKSFSRLLKEVEELKNKYALSCLINGITPEKIKRDDMENLAVDLKKDMANVEDIVSLEKLFRVYNQRAYMMMDK